MTFTENQYGFAWGPVTVERIFSDEPKGWVVIGVETQKEALQIYVTKTGRVTISDDNGKWRRPEA